MKWSVISSTVTNQGNYLKNNNMTEKLEEIAEIFKLHYSTPNTLLYEESLISQCKALLPSTAIY